MTVTIPARAGHSRSQKIDQRARLSARCNKVVPLRASEPEPGALALSIGCSVNSVSCNENLRNFRILTCK